MQSVLQVAFFHGATRSAKVSLERECYPDISSINGKNKLLLIIATILLYPHSPSKFRISTFLAILSTVFQHVSLKDLDFYRMLLVLPLKKLVTRTERWLSGKEGLGLVPITHMAAHTSNSDPGYPAPSSDQLKH